MRITAAIGFVIGCASGRPDPDPPNVDEPAADAPSSTNDDASTSDGPASIVRTIEIYSGDGTMMMGGWPGGDQLKAIVVENGVGVPGVSVQWATVSGAIALTGGFQTGAVGTSVTDANGIARVGMRGDFLSQQVSAVPSTIRASIAEGSVEFHAWSTYWTQGIPALPAAYINSERDLGVRAPNEIVSDALVAQVVFQAGSNQGQGMPGVGVRFVVGGTDPTTDTAPAVACANATVGVRSGGTVFTGANGIASCDVKMPAVPGTYSIGVFVGGAIHHSPFSVRIQ